jgi:hypothetical protein
MEVSKRPEFDGVLRVSAGKHSTTGQSILRLANIVSDKLDAKFAELGNNKASLQYWVSTIYLFITLKHG